MAAYAHIKFHLWARTTKLTDTPCAQALRPGAIHQFGGGGVSRLPT